MTEESLFHEALSKPPAERAAYLEKACAGHPELQAAVESLLAAHDASGSFLAQPREVDVATITLAPRAEATSPPPFVECPGTRIGPYKLLQQIGEGGMGTVWMAEQMEPVRRNVALKIVKAGLDSNQVIARFEAERQALALMDHPNIARVLDAGATASGRPFFVMELVKGAPITKYCDDHKLTVRQRLEIFIPVCLALQHAHQKGIIHRDIKPSNVLVAPYDGKPVVKVIDFGVAKATGQRLTEKTMFTQFGAVIGTLEYMSPEQAELNNQDIDTRSDIYALGVLLYELLTGTTPLDMQRLRGAAFAAILMQIQENEPPRPSTRLSESRETRAVISAQRQTDPARLARLVRGELDWIVMKALDKDRSRRYDTAGNFARDIEHHLREEPVDAGPPSATYRLRKLLRRNRGAVAAAVVVLLALVGGTMGTTLGLVRANRALDAEAEQRRQAETARSQETQARDEAERSLYFNRVNLAYQYWLGSHLDQSSRILDLCPPAARGWEWRYINQLHHADLLTLPDNTFTNLRFSKDGKRLAAFACSKDADATVRIGDPGVRVRIWDLTAGKPPTQVDSFKVDRQFASAALTADGNMIALGENSGAITLWQSDAGKLVPEFAKLKKSASSLSFSPDGRWLAAARADERKEFMYMQLLGKARNEDLVVWDVASGKELFHPKGYGVDAEFSSDGSRLLTYRKNTVLRLTPMAPEFSVALFDTTTWTEVASGQLGAADSSCFSGDGKRLALGGFDYQTNRNFLRIMDTTNGKELYSLTPGEVGEIALNNDGTIIGLAGGFRSTQIAIWDVKNGRQIGALRGHRGSINAIAFAPDGRLASCASDNTIKFWDPNSGQDVRYVTRPHILATQPAVLSPSGTILAYGQYATVNRFMGPGGTVTVVDAQTGRVTHTLAGHRGRPQPLAFSGDSTRLASGDEKGDVKIWDVPTGALICTIPGKGEETDSLALSSDGRWVAATRRGRIKPAPVVVELFNAETGQMQLTLPGHPSWTVQLAFSGDGKLLASACGRQVEIWDLTTGLVLRELNQSEFRSGTSDALVFSKSSSLLATAGGGTAQIWDVASGRSISFFEWPARSSLCVAINPDENRLATGDGKEVKLWDIRSGQEILNLPLPQQTNSHENVDNVANLAWSADGQRLRAALTNGAVVEWTATRTQ